MLIPFKQLWERYQIKSPGVLHLGANTGQEALAYDQQGVTQVVWVEALPSLYQELVQNINVYPGQRALRACLSDVNGKQVDFHITSNNGQSSSFLELWTHKIEHPTVTVVRDISMVTIRLDTLLAKYQIKVGPGWFLNVDLQGAELLALKGMGDLLKQFDYAYVEVNTRQLYKGCPLVGEIDAYLDQYHFVGREVKMTGSGWGDKFYERIAK